jgi:hypothetical protein
MKSAQQSKEIETLKLSLITSIHETFRWILGYCALHISVWFVRWLFFFFYRNLKSNISSSCSINYEQLGLVWLQNYRIPVRS